MFCLATNSDSRSEVNLQRIPGQWALLCDKMGLTRYVQRCFFFYRGLTLYHRYVFRHKPFFTCRDFASGYEKHLFQSWRVPHAISNAGSLHAI